MQPQDDQEEWRPVVDYGGWYDVSNLGRVRSWIKRGACGRNKSRVRLDKPRLRKLRLHKGYIHVTLHDTTYKSHFPSVHKLVLAAFIGPRPEGLQTRHLDGNKLNNRISNLCYGTQAENEQDKRRHGRVRTSCKSGEIVRQIRQMHAQGRSTKEISNCLAVPKSTIQNITAGRAWQWLPLCPDEQVRNTSGQWAQEVVQMLIVLHAQPKDLDLRGDRLILNMQRRYLACCIEFDLPDYLRVPVADVLALAYERELHKRKLCALAAKASLSARCVAGSALSGG